MGPATAIIIIVGLPLILIGGGFFLLTLKAFRSGDARTERAQTLELARKLERTLNSMESRLIALEDIILSSDDHSGRAGNREGNDDRI
ncbi:hypothetical protein C4J81_01160 [Deltaproteobacteria bacterium Smac51]|nr:hypothetical protein C4J81_01160 [Deltaproteobacteria bacterium Smac51]